MNNLIDAIVAEALYQIFRDSENPRVYHLAFAAGIVWPASLATAPKL